MFDFDAVFTQDFIQRLTRRNVGLETDDFLAGERFELDGFLLGKGMLRVADEHKRLLAQRNDFQFRILDRIRDEAEVNDVAEHIVINLVGAAILDVDVHGRVALHEAFDIRRQVMQANGINRCHADCPGNDVLQFLQFAVQRFVGLDDLLAVFVKHLAFAREAEFFLAALDEERLKSAFQRADLLADGGLGDAVDLRRLGETFGLGQIAEDFQAFDLHKKN